MAAKMQNSNSADQLRSWTVPYLRLADPPEGLGGEGDHLGVDALVVPVAEQQVELAVVLERLLLPLGHVDDQRPVQPRRPLHPVVPVVEVRPRLQPRTKLFSFS